MRFKDNKRLFGHTQTSGPTPRWKSWVAGPSAGLEQSELLFFTVQASRHCPLMKMFKLECSIASVSTDKEPKEERTQAPIMTRKTIITQMGVFTMVSG